LEEEEEVKECEGVERDDGGVTELDDEEARVFPAKKSK
jgi:hypothetical protein